MDGFEGVDVYTPIILLDRTGQGGGEIIVNGVRLNFPKGRPEMAVPRFVAEWLFTHGKHMVWTTDGIFTNRYGVKDAPEDFTNAFGEESGDCSPIEIDGNRIEGWDTTAVERDESTRVVPVSVPAQALRERQGSTGTYAFGSRK